MQTKSVTEQNSLEEFLNTAELAGTDFESGESFASSTINSLTICAKTSGANEIEIQTKILERLNLNFVSPKNVAGVLSVDDKKKLHELHQKNIDLLRIPRR